MAIALDTETTISTDAEPVPRLVSVALAGEGWSKLYPYSDPACYPDVFEAFREGCILANAPFDVHVLLRQWPDLLPDILDAYWNDRIFDVLTREKLIDIAQGTKTKDKRYGLGPVALRRADIELNKNDPYRMRYEALLGLPIEAWPEGAKRYALDDATATYAVFEAQEFVRVWEGLFTLEEAGRQARKHIALYSHERRGLQTDRPFFRALLDKFDTEIAEHLEECRKSGLVRDNAKRDSGFSRNLKLAQQMMADVCGDTARRTGPSTKFPEGQVALSEEALNAAEIPAGHPLDHYRQLGSKDTQRTRLRSYDVPVVRTHYDELVASGRTSSAHPQVQNLTPAWRPGLVAAPEHVLLISDWSAAELVALAQVQLDLFGQSALADMLIAGRKPHAELGCRLFGIDPATFNKKLPDHARAYQAAKPYNFGKPVGMGQARFIEYCKNDYGVIITPEQEAEYSDEYHRMFPEAKMLQQYVNGLQDRHTRTIDIVQPRSGRLRGGLGFCDACNTHFQGLAADAAGDALWNIWVAGLDSTSPLYGGMPVVRPDGTVPTTGGVLFVHDEIVTQVRREVAAEALVEQERIMIEAFGRWCPDVPIGVESHISERYGKS